MGWNLIEWCSICKKLRQDLEIVLPFYLRTRLIETIALRITVAVTTKAFLRAKTFLRRA